MNRPYKETAIGNKQYIREFDKYTNTDELEWHLDREDRIVEVIQNTGWQFQMDNQLPNVLKETIFVPKETYHRIIKGTGKLVVKITKK